MKKYEPFFFTPVNKFSILKENETATKKGKAAPYLLCEDMPSSDRIKYLHEYKLRLISCYDNFQDENRNKFTWNKMKRHENKLLEEIKNVEKKIKSLSV